MISRLVRNKYFLLVLGLFVLGIGLIPNDGTVRCGGNVMQPGDTCRHTTDGITTGTNTYDQEKTAGQHSNVELEIAGGLITLGALGWIGFSLVGSRKKAEPVGTAAVQQSVISGS